MVKHLNYNDNNNDSLAGRLSLQIHPLPFCPRLCGPGEGPERMTSSHLLSLASDRLSQWRHQEEPRSGCGFLQLPVWQLATRLWQRAWLKVTSPARQPSLSLDFSNQARPGLVRPRAGEAFHYDELSATELFLIVFLTFFSLNSPRITQFECAVFC